MIGSYLLPRREIERNRFMLKMSLVRPITKRFVGRPATPTQRNQGAALQPIHVAIHVNNLKITFDFRRTIVVDRYLRFAHLNCS